MAVVTTGYPLRMESLETSLPYLSQYSYLGVFVLILVFSVAPLSKTLVIVAGGVLASQGVGSLGLYLLVSVAALVTADGAYYLLGYFGGTRVTQWRFFSAPSKARRFAKAGEIFRRHDWSAVFSARFLPFVRSFIFIVAGWNRMSPLRFVSADLISAGLYVPPALGLGYFVGENRALLVRYVEQGEWLLAALVVVILAVVLVLRRRKT
jgi:membrane protein DedA with SNARE-associated domain